ncbi:hypothetical protein GDO81_023774 [Engystomops pustulosus]|uniref:Uncharacterized protein n=1 Tax=Engystomops pustulosus TaxID=76066 RepID=A0AAV6ZBW2_ENGPU|nr:hypothetical protein GDO81_023774 [Engystomops pustulosus]
MHHIPLKGHDKNMLHVMNLRTMDEATCQGFETLKTPVGLSSDMWWWLPCRTEGNLSQMP